MAEYTLKAFYNPTVVKQIGAMMRDAWPGFPVRPFVTAATRGLDELELIARARHIAQAMHAALPADFAEAVAILIRSLGPVRVATEGDGMAPFLYLPHCIYVAEHGQDHFDQSMHALRELTIRFSSEFPIRSFLARHPGRTWKQLRTWATDENEHVRRLVSEGTRPRLPWAPRVPGLVENPGDGLALLEMLKDDPSLYVRRSVANHLNDVSYAHPELVIGTCARWMKGAGDERRWLVSHALRTLVKKGNRQAMNVLGFGGHDGVDVTGTVTPRKIRIGESIRIAVTVRNRANRTRRVVVDLGVHFVKANGGTARKVFKGKPVELDAGGALTFSKSISFQQHSTRTHFPGRHRVEALLNGEPIELGTVDVRRA